ncbi:phenylalanine--tRNA ligase subunit beta [Chlamydia sp.]|uniref:phenylalanine--tRNA ligase subunit beta n=1 Tax=Chlamydia sp. TaxID=35827 RepID=UPI0025BB7ABD|nr:phenylalanine--tRNA ligase subunit beta [Chlamydia sp.]MBQ8498626.1 phenylalanine--tRNA ligase subunit beta [Chlamydia sp.]
MLVPLSLLQKFFSSPLSVKDILEACDRIGIEAECPNVFPDSLNSVVTGKILSTSPHPDAERLSVAIVFDGEKERQIVCGAPNCLAGIIVPVALPGAKIRNTSGEVTTIKKSKIRGLESQGMCCGADELGFPHLQKGDRGIFEFPQNTPLGESACLLLAGASLECSLTPNLGHCASLLGLAREISFLSPTSLSIPEEFSFTPLPLENCSNSAHDLTACPVFYSVKISGLSWKPSPDNLQAALIALGQQPLNAVIDITNYVMLSLGQPLHAYDSQAIDQKSIHVTTVKSPESFTFLNKETHFLPEGALVVADQHKILGLAGVMGGAASSFSEKTTETILEAAYFVPQSVRKYQRTIQLHTEAAYRFTRGVDPQGVLPALYAAIHMIQALFPEAQISPIQKLGECESHPLSLSIRPKIIKRILDVSLSPLEIAEKLSSLGFRTTAEEETVRVEVPSYRYDIQEETDLVEEICRTTPFIQKTQKILPVYTPIYALKRALTSFLADGGLQQFFTCSLLDTEVAMLSLQESSLIPIQGSAMKLRDSLLPGMLKSAATNLNRQAPYVYAFEIGNVYSKEQNRYKEEEHIAILLTQQAVDDSWQGRTPLSFYTIKGWVEKLLNHIGTTIEDLTVQPSQHPNFHPYQQASLYHKKQCLGIFGTLHPQLCKKSQIKYGVVFAELSLNGLLSLKKKSEQQYVPYPVYPASSRDITITMDKDVPADHIRKELLSFESKWLESVHIVSVYQGRDSTSQSKNVSFRMVFRDQERTLSGQEIEEEYNRLISLLDKKSANIGKGNS